MAALLFESNFPVDRMGSDTQRFGKQIMNDQKPTLIR